MHALSKVSANKVSKKYIKQVNTYLTKNSSVPYMALPFSLIYYFTSFYLLIVNLLHKYWHQHRLCVLLLQSVFLFCQLSSCWRTAQSKTVIHHLSKKSDGRLCFFNIHYVISKILESCIYFFTICHTLLPLSVTASVYCKTNWGHEYK